MAIGIFYKDALGFQQNTEQALYWFKQAVDLNHQMSQLYLAWFTLHGFGLPSDEKKSVDWFIKANEDETKIANLKNQTIIPNFL